MAVEREARKGWVTRAVSQLRQVLRADELALAVVLVLMCILIGVLNPQFWSAENLRDIARSTSFVFVVAVAGTLVLIAGALDLSVGSTYGLGGVVAGLVLVQGYPVPIAVLVGLAAGGAVGMLNGLIVVRLRVPSLIATLGTLYAIRGIVLVLTGGAPVFPFPADFIALGRGEFVGLPYPVWVAIGVGVGGHLLLTRTVIGSLIYSVGGNETAAYLAGIAIDRVRVFVLVLSGTAAALGGILVSARISSAQVNSGAGLELSVIAAVIIGGTSLFGGAGSVLGTLIGALLISVIANGLVLVRVDPFYQNIVVGAIIVLAVAIDGWRRRRAAGL